MVRPAATRFCFEIRVHPQLLDEYLALHAPVRPETLEALWSAGRRNYSMFLTEGARIIGYYECEDEPAAVAALAESDAVARWNAEMARFFDEAPGAPLAVPVPFVEVFNLEQQLSEHRSAIVRGAVTRAG